MRIGLNATCFNFRPSGAKQRFIGIYTALIRQMSGAEFVIYEPSDCNIAGLFKGFPNVSSRKTIVRSTGFWRRQLSAQLYWPYAFSRESFDVFEGMSLPFFHSPSGFNILTIHDLRYIHASKHGPNHLLSTYIIRKALHIADHVIAVSSSMKKEILDFYPHANVSVIYNGFDPVSFGSVCESASQSFLTRNLLPEEYLLAVGHLEKRKNYSALINAVSLLHKRGIRIPLLIVGNDSGELASLQNQVASLNLSRYVHILTSLTNKELRDIYKSCSLFVFSSSYEGFGIPILEAMASGCPMVLSDLPVFREITEGQSIYFPHEDIASIADAIERGLTSSSFRERMVAYGYSRVNDFTFDKMASKLSNVYTSG